ncbi:hypothetical protein OOZ57_07135 [Proteus mirabilis]|uniref:hypothetical protein n=1 Tax=Proteus mirabilis TaxID=584 RepID=UPI001A234A32|nr:hypothetical protein [Proteus mirabilis]MBI6234945.1 hypothetical protein [Proteus mirabilis]UZK74083.1 hypothetical protein OOZ57_07135 [Proteus mirabilis]
MKYTIVKGKVTLPANVKVSDLLVKLKKNNKSISEAKSNPNIGPSCIEIKGDSSEEFLHNYAKEIVSSMGGYYEKL